MADIPISFGGGGGAGSDDVTASKNQVLAGYTAITTDSDDEPTEGTIPTKGAATYNTSTEDQTISSNQYLGGNQIIKAVTTSNVDAGNIKKDVVVKVGDGNNEGRIKNITGTYTTVSGKTAAGAAQILSGYAAYANGSAQIDGTIGSKGAATYTPTTSNQTIAAGQYLSGAQTIKGDSNLVSANILYGKSIFDISGSVRKYAYTFADYTSSSSTQSYTTGSGTKSFYYLTLSPGYIMLVITAMVVGSSHNGSQSLGSWGVEVRTSSDGNGYMCEMNPQGSSTKFPVHSGSTVYKASIAGYY